MFYKLEDFEKKDLKEIENICELRRNLSTKYRQTKYFNRIFHIMKNEFDYLDGYKNYLCIKDISNCYIYVGSKYPSPTGRPSRKYPYPVRQYDFYKNNSYATCYKLMDTKLDNIHGGR